MELNDIKIIQKLTDKYRSKNLIFCGEIASFSFSSLFIEIWKNEGQYSTYLLQGGSPIAFPLIDLATMIQLTTQEPYQVVEEIESSLEFIHHNSLALSTLLSQNDFEEIFIKQIGRQPLTSPSLI
jgi:hypothetical protein